MRNRQNEIEKTPEMYTNRYEQIKQHKNRNDNKKPNGIDLVKLLRFPGCATLTPYG